MKKHIAPSRIFVSLFTFSLFTIIYSATAISFGNESLSFWSVAFLAAGALCLLMQVLFCILLYTRKGIQADEYTTYILYKAGYYTYIVCASLICILFLIMYMVIMLNREAVSLESIIDIKVIVGLFAAVQLIGTVLYVLLFFFLNKKGEYKDGSE